jgi:hypothetical protein
MPLTVAEKQQLLAEAMMHMSIAAMGLGSSNAQAAAGGNLAFILVSLKGQPVFREHAFSNSSSLGQALRSDFSPSIGQAQLGGVGVANGMQHGNHTEPKLWLSFVNQMRANFRPFDRIVLASQLDCCKPCVNHTISAFNGLTGLLDIGSATAINFIVVEVNSGRVREGHEF